MLASTGAPKPPVYRDAGRRLLHDGGYHSTLFRMQRRRHDRFSRLGLGAPAAGRVMIELPHGFLNVLFAALVIAADVRKRTSGGDQPNGGRSTGIGPVSSEIATLDTIYASAVILA